MKQNKTIIRGEMYKYQCTIVLTGIGDFKGVWATKKRQSTRKIDWKHFHVSHNFKQAELLMNLIKY